MPLDLMVFVLLNFRINFFFPPWGQNLYPVCIPLLYFVSTRFKGVSSSKKRKNYVGISCEFLPMIDVGDINMKF